MRPLSYLTVSSSSSLPACTSLRKGVRAFTQCLGLCFLPPVRQWKGERKNKGRTERNEGGPTHQAFASLICYQSRLSRSCGCLFHPGRLQKDLFSRLGAGFIASSSHSDLRLPKGPLTQLWARHPSPRIHLRVRGSLFPPK